MAEQPPEHVNAAFLEGPQTITTPLWVAASGISTEARCLVEPLLASAMRVRDQAPTLDRQFLAWWINLPRHDKGLQSYLDELVGIGFLVIYDGGIGKDGRRLNRRDPKTRRGLQDTYALRLETPSGYAGPKNLPEAHAWFQHDYQRARHEHEERVAAGKKSRVFPVKRTLFGTLDDQVTARTPTSGVRTDSPYPNTGGTDLFSQVTARTPTSGVRTDSPYPNTGGTDLFAQDKPVPQNMGYLYIGDTSGISVGEIPEVVGSAAPPADAGAGAAAHDDVDWARQLVRELPWRSVLRRELKKPEANDLADGFRRAHHVHGLTKDQVQEYALTKLASADPEKNPVRWVIGAFKDQRLAQYVAWLETEPLSSSPLSLPETADQDDGEPKKPASERSQPASDDLNAATWCGDCVPVRTETGKRCSSDCSGQEKAATDSGPTGGGMPEHVRAELHARREQERLDRIRRIHGYSA